VSFGKRSEMDTSDVWGPPKLKDKDAKLIHYLAKHKHTSPFGHCFASFHVKAPVFVARQLVKHKFLRWNEISRRYVDHGPEFYQPTEWRGRSVDTKQGSAGQVDVGDWGDVNWACLTAYKDLLSQGVCPEQARMVLPQSMVTEWYWSGSLDAFADMCNLRCKSDTQYETQVVAGHIDTEMTKLFPVSWEALRENK
jgi:thymidylate synthase (FAD)